MDILIPQLLTFLNDQDWELRYAFCSKIGAVCVFVGPTVTTKCIIPCIEMALYDVEEMVVCRAVSCLSSLVELSLLPNAIAMDVFKTAAPLLMHPSSVIQSEAIHLVAAMVSVIGDVDAYVFVLPVISSCLKYSLVGAKLTEDSLKSSLKPRLKRSVYRRALHSKLDSDFSGNSSRKTSVEVVGEDSLHGWLDQRSRHETSGSMEDLDGEIIADSTDVETVSFDKDGSGRHRDFISFLGRQVTFAVCS